MQVQTPVAMRAQFQKSSQANFC